jgi:DNA polymerase III epsilon subunit-like protein
MIYTFIDTETTGLDIIQHEVIQIGLIQIETLPIGYRIREAVEFNIKPHHIELAEPVALKINGYSEEKWKGSKHFLYHCDEITDIVESSDVLIGQNLIFDMRFIKQAFKQADFKCPRFPKYIDTKWMADQLKQKGIVPSSSMDKLCEHFQIKFTGRAHNALADCERTLKLWEILKKDYVDEKYFTFEEPYDPYATKK